MRLPSLSSDVRSIANDSLALLLNTELIAINQVRTLGH